MSLTVNAATYTADSFQQNRVGYIGTNHSVTVKDYVSLSRVAPKPTATFSGLGRTEAKLTRTVTLTNALTPTADAIVTISVAIPVGMAAAGVDVVLNDMGAFLASASFKTHVKAQQIAY